MIHKTLELHLALMLCFSGNWGDRHNINVIQFTTNGVESESRQEPLGCVLEQDTGPYLLKLPQLDKT